jgi:hypothetical protein
VNNAAIGNYYVKVFGVSGAFHASDSYKVRVNKKSTPYRFAESENEQGILEVNISPNPVKQSAFLSFDGIESSSLKIQVLDVNGRIIKNETLILENEISGFHLDVSSFNAGAYYIFCISDEQLAKARMVVVK